MRKGLDIVNIFDESAIRSFDAPASAIDDAVKLGSELAGQEDMVPEGVQCHAYPPDGVKLVLSTGDRLLHLFFFGNGRAVFGQSLTSTGNQIGAGEFSLDGVGLSERMELFRWLAGA